MSGPVGSPARHCGVVGDPIGHSLSPALHRAAYDAVGLAWTYDPHRVSVAELAGFVAALDETWRGLSLTMPLKREAARLATRVSERVRRSGAANTLVIDGKDVSADNTDIPGIAAALTGRYAGPLGRVAVWGGGATAASAVLAMAELGCRQVALHVRDPARAASTLAAAGGAGVSLDVVDLAEPVEADVLISTIPAGAQLPGLVEAAVGAVGAVFDVLYDPWPTPLAAAARAAGTVVVPGLDLLVHQAALQFRAFTGLPGPLTVMREAGERELAARAAAQK